jgi:hypothetical protein
VTFTSIFPACYAGRWPHVHFEVYPTWRPRRAPATRSRPRSSRCRRSRDEVYATAGYEQSVRNLSQVSLATDNVFADGSALELATVTGSRAGGYTAMLTVAV